MRVILITILLLISACNGRDGRLDLAKPVSLDMTPPEGPANYKVGWQDGCESGLSSTNGKVQLFLGTHQYRYDYKMDSDFLYKTAWKHAYQHCAFSMRSMAKYKYM